MHLRFTRQPVSASSTKQSLVSAIVEQLSALNTVAYFRERMVRGDAAGFDAWLAASQDTAPDADDEIPED